MEFKKDQRVRYIEAELDGIDGPSILGVVVTDQFGSEEWVEILFDGETETESIHPEYLRREE